MKLATQHFIELAQMTTETLFHHLQTLLLDHPAYGEGQTWFSPGKKQNYVFGIPKGNAPKLALVAHIDTVASNPPAAITNQNGLVFTQGGGVLGADDRAGVCAVLNLLAAYHDASPETLPAVYFCNHEESGCQGAKALASEHTPPDSIRLLIEMDRANHSDFVTYSCDSKTLDSYISSFGFIKQRGSCSDISHLMPNWKIAAANLSIGYYGQHTSSEYLVVPQMLHTAYKVEQMLLHPPAKRIDYETEPVKVYASPSLYSGYGYSARKEGQVWDSSTAKYRWWNRNIRKFQDTDPHLGPIYDIHITEIVTRNAKSNYETVWKGESDFERMVTQFGELELGAANEFGSVIVDIKRRQPFLTQVVAGYKGYTPNANNCISYKAHEMETLKTRLVGKEIKIGAEFEVNKGLHIIYIKWSDGRVFTLKNPAGVSPPEKTGKKGKKKKEKPTTPKDPTQTLVVTFDSVADKPRTDSDTKVYTPAELANDNPDPDPDLFTEPEEVICIACNAYRNTAIVNSQGVCDRCISRLAGTPYEEDAQLTHRDLYGGYYD